MKKLNLFLIAVSLLINFSCSNEELANPETINEDLLLIEKERNDLVDLFDFSNKNVLLTESGKLEYYEMLENDNSFIFKDDQNNLSLVSILKNGKYLYEGINTDLNFEFESIYDKKLGHNVVDLSVLNNHFNSINQKSSSNCDTNLALDYGLCLVFAAAIAASDGPLPFMDAAAVTYGTACMARAALAYEDCVNGQ